MSEIVKSSRVTGAMQIRSVADMQNVAQLLAQSGYFKDAQDASQCFVKILAGQEMGVGAFASMTGIHVIQGKPAAGAGIMSSRVKAHPNYNYRVLGLDDKACKIEFFEKWDGKFQSAGISEFSVEDAKRAGTQNIGKFPRNMLFARAMSNGVKWFCPDVFDAPVYTPEELGASVDDDGNVIDVESFSTTQPQPNPITDRFNFIAAKTGHDREAAIAAANAVGVPPSSKQMSPEQFVRFRNRLLAEWGLAQSAFSHINHAVASLRHVSGHDGHDDVAVWRGWKDKVDIKVYESRSQDEQSPEDAVAYDPEVA